MRFIKKLITGIALITSCLLANPIKADSLEGKLTGSVNIFHNSGEKYSKFGVPIRLGYSNENLVLGITAGTETFNGNTTFALGPNLAFGNDGFTFAVDYRYINSDAKSHGVLGKDKDSNNIAASLSAGDKVRFLADAEAKLSAETTFSAKAGAGIKNIVKNLSPYVKAGYERDNFYEEPNATYALLGIDYHNKALNLNTELPLGQKIGFKLTPSVEITKNLNLNATFNYDNTNSRSNTLLFFGFGISN